MFWPYIPYFRSIYPKQKRIWNKIRFIHETDKAILVLCEGRKLWIPKSRIRKMILKKDVFKIYAKEITVE